MAGNIKQVKTSDDVLHDLEVDLTNYYDKSEADTLLSAKADITSVYSKSEADLLLANKADKSDIYTKAQLDTLFDSKANVNTVYTKGETDLLLGGKADVSTTYTKSETDSLLLGKADSDDVYPKSETYNRTQIGDLLATKADTNSVYSKGDVDGLLADKANASDVYTITQTDALLGDKADVTAVSGLAGTVAQLDSKVDLNYQNTAKLDTTNVFTNRQNLDKSALIISDDTLDSTNPPQAIEWYQGGVSINDANGRQFYIQAMMMTDGTTDLHITTDTSNNPSGKVFVNNKLLSPVQEQFVVKGTNLWATSTPSVTISHDGWYQVGVSGGFITTNPNVLTGVPGGCLVYANSGNACYHNYYLTKGMILYLSSGAQGKDLYEIFTN